MTNSIDVTKKVETPKAALVYLHAEAMKEDEEIAAAIYKVKINNDYKKNLSELHKCSKELLAKTYSWLMKVKEDHEEILLMKKEGLKKMMIWRIFQITAEQCGSCHQVVHLKREEEYLVSCWECGKGGCKDCYATAMGKNWKYLCTFCMDTIGNLRGFQALNADVDLLKVKPKRKEKKKDSNIAEVMLVDDAEEPTGEKDDSCIFTNDAEEAAEEDETEEGEMDDPQNAFVMPVVRRGYLGEKSNDTGENNKGKDKTCSHFLRGRCRWGMSGRRPIKSGGNRVETSESCQYEH